MTTCTHSNVRTHVLQDSPHYAKATCADCGEFLKWLPHPVVDLRSAAIPGNEGPETEPELTGTPKQQAFGKAVRFSRSRLWQIQAAELPSGDRELRQKAVRAAVRTVADSSWWIANKAASVLWFGCAYRAVP